MTPLALNMTRVVVAEQRLDSGSRDEGVAYRIGLGGGFAQGSARPIQEETPNSTTVGAILLRKPKRHTRFARYHPCRSGTPGGSVC